MNTHTLNFLESMLFGHCWEYSELSEEDVTIHDICEEFTREIDTLISSFESRLEESYPIQFEKLGDLERSFGGNIYFSLSGHGVGFQDEMDHDLSKLGALLKVFTGKPYMFEQIELTREEDGAITVS